MNRLRKAGFAPAIPLTLAKGSCRARSPLLRGSEPLRPVGIFRNLWERLPTNKVFGGILRFQPFFFL